MTAASTTITGDPRLTPARPDVAAAHLRGLVAAERFVTGTMHWVRHPRAALMATADVAAALASELLFGEDFIVYDAADGWAWGQAPRDGYVGYVRADALTALEGTPGALATHMVRVPASHLYPVPDLKRPPLQPLYATSLVAVAADAPAENGFLPLLTGGWVFAAHLQPLAALGGDHTAAAERFLEAPYLWGGRTAAGIDCSGLVQAALFLSGMSSPRDSDQQAAMLGAELAPETALERGDLVFFPGHVGIMLDPVRLLHANATHMAVTIDPLAEVIAIVGKTSARPVTARRRLKPKHP